MRFLNPHRLNSSIAIVAEHLNGITSPSQQLKTNFIQALNRVQRTSIRASDAGIVIDFENAELLDQLIEGGVFDQGSRPDGGFQIELSQRAFIFDQIQASFQFIKFISPELWRLIDAAIGSIACFKTVGRGGGTSSNFVGLIHLSPVPEWDLVQYSENIVHEFVHNSLFIEDMVHTIFVDPARMDRDEALVISAIRKVPRTIDKSFHSACVAATLMFFHHLRGDEEKARSFLSALRITVQDMTEVDNRLRVKHQSHLSANGLEIWNEIRSFSIDVDYDRFHVSLK